MTDPIRIWIGCSANDEDIEFMSTVHYSLERHTTAPLDVHWLRLSRDPDSFWYSDPKKKQGWCTTGWATPFSALRWGIPAYCNFEGKAIYMDLDMIAMADISKLWNQPFAGGAAMISKPEAICVSVYDNARMKDILPPIEQIRQEGLYRHIRKQVVKDRGVIRRYEGNWNCLDMRKDTGGEYDSPYDPDIKVLHFTEIPTQPHLRLALPRLEKEGVRHWYTKAPMRRHHRQDAVQVFDKMLAEAQLNGYEVDRYRNPTPFGDYGRQPP